MLGAGPRGQVVVVVAGAVVVVTVVVVVVATVVVAVVVAVVVVVGAVYLQANLKALLHASSRQAPGLFSNIDC